MAHVDLCTPWHRIFGYFALALVLINLASTSATSAAVLTVLVTFNGLNGSSPDSELLADAAGNLYGTTRTGYYDHDHGTIFRLDTETNVLTTLVDFDGANGTWPRGGLIADDAGNLYGTTYFGGASNVGVIYRFEVGTNTLTTLAEFNGVNGRRPSAGLIADAAGNLYGTTSFGGKYDRGTIFRLNFGSNILTTLVDFDFSNGGYPKAGLIADAAGNLYGTTLHGGVHRGGTIFRFAVDTNSLTTLADFDNDHYAVNMSRLITDSAGNLFGTRATLDALGNEVFRLEAGTNSLTTIAGFDPDIATYPISALIADSAGNLYGTTLYNCCNVGHGTVFRVSDAGFVVPEPASLELAIPACFALLFMNCARSHSETQRRSVDARNCA
jgi:uncharacterized repeat protein (TIGR03803 family)